jgi:hypothetical protein
MVPAPRIHASRRRSCPGIEQARLRRSDRHRLARRFAVAIASSGAAASAIGESFVFGESFL